ncbi:hypothetical protein EK21DRAFT_107633 [Setomelanomma holmii]|uniref:Uncharacterized protein n=1 Tax=Setomelanomma holmii TaxID=210430 RepID=A0A9P4HL60_9PLEO|nr:hypothetical protein EK21DRAFT_107633 [Setomelanomma holmii]
MQFRANAILAAVVVVAVAAMPAEVVDRDVNDISAGIVDRDVKTELDAQAITQGTCKTSKKGLGKHGSCFIGANGEHRACASNHACTGSRHHCSVSDAPGGQVVCS